MNSKVAVAFGLASVAGLASAEFRALPGGTAVPGKYHVRLDPSITSESQIDPALRAKLSDVFVTVSGAELTTTNMTLINEVVAHKQAFYVQPVMVVDSSTFSGWGPDPVLPDTPATAQLYDVISPDSWGVKRLAGVPLKGAPYAGGNGDGEGVDLYVVSTGVSPDHPQLTGRVNNFFEDKSLQAGFEGALGTMFAGIAGGANGVAKKATIQSVKVATGNGKTDTIKLMRAAHQIITRRDQSRPSVVYWPFFGPNAGALANSVRFLAATPGVFVVAPAGASSAASSCSQPPGNQLALADFLTVGATDPSDKAAIYSGSLFSAIGPCVNIMAPGWNVRAPNPFNATQDNYITSATAAAAHVAGIAALVRGKYPKADNDQIRTAILSMTEDKPTFVDPTIELTPKKIARLNFDNTLCKSKNQAVVNDKWCQEVNCDASYKALCELNARTKAGQVCVSVMANIPDSWCAATGCHVAYAGMCQLKCSE